MPRASPDSKVKANNHRLRIYQSLVEFLEGKGLMPFWGQFEGPYHTSRLYALDDQDRSRLDLSRGLDEVGWRRGHDLNSHSFSAAHTC